MRFDTDKFYLKYLKRDRIHVSENTLFGAKGLKLLEIDPSVIKRNSWLRCLRNMMNYIGCGSSVRRGWETVSR